MSAGVALARTNPYVGPESFRRGRALYGRDREVADLLDLLVAERVVLLHSPSGAGKTSLIQAQMMGRLEEDGFEVLPVLRVTHELPPDAHLAVTPRNRYVFSTLLSLEEGIPTEHQHTVDQLAEMTIAQYMALWPDLDGRPGNELLVFDQFEEIFTSDAIDQKAKEEFFADVGAALRDRTLWALFSMREDFLAQLDPYARLVPTRFATRYRLDLLDVDAALEAMTRPAQDAGVRFDVEAATKLTDDLRRIRVQRGDEAIDDFGPYVEPVQLQVACRRVWARLDEGAESIGLDDVAAAGDVDQALAGYYADCVSLTSEATGVRERTLRDWFEQELITPQGFRSQVLRGPLHASGSDDQVLVQLTDAHLLRTESRRGAVWYELSHDRLVEPVREDNARWRQRHLSDFERRAVDWDQQGKPDQLLLAGPELHAALAKAAARADPPSAREQDFLAASEKAQRAAERELRANARTRKWLVVAVIGCVLALVTAGLAVRSSSQAQDQKAQANEARRAAQRSALIGQGVGALSNDAQLGLLVGERAAAISGGSAARMDDETRNLLQQALDITPVAFSLRGHGPAAAVDFGDDGRAIATSDEAGRLRLWDAGTGVQLGTHAGIGPANTVRLSPAGDLVAVSGEARVAIWDAGGNGPLRETEHHKGTVYGLAFSPDGSQLASAGADGQVVLMDPATGRKLRSLKPRGDDTLEINDVTWTPDGGRVLAVDDGGRMTTWDSASGRQIGQGRRHAAIAMAVDVSPDGEQVATGDLDGKVVIGPVADGSGDEVETPYGDSVVALGFSGDSSRLTAFDRFGNAAVFDAVTGGSLGVVTPIGESLVDADVDPAHPDRAVLAVTESDPAVWKLTVGHSSRVQGLDVADGGSAVTAAEDGTVRRWSPDAEEEEVLVRAPRKVFWAVAVSPDQRFVVTADSAGAATVRWLGPRRRVPLADDGMQAVAVSPGGTVVATAGWGDFDIHLWDPVTGESQGVLTGHGGDVTALEFGGPGDDRLASVSSDGTVGLWDLATTEQWRQLTTDATTVAWSPAGDRVATAGANGVIRLWDPETGRTVARLRDHTSEVNDVSFDSTGQRLVSASDDRTMVLWDVATGQVIRRIRHNSSWVQWADFVGDDRLMATDYLGAPHVVYLDPEELLRVAKQRTTRDLSTAECRRLLDGAPCPRG